MMSWGLHLRRKLKTPRPVPLPEDERAEGLRVESSVQDPPAPPGCEPALQKEASPCVDGGSGLPGWRGDVPPRCLRDSGRVRPLGAVLEMPPPARLVAGRHGVLGAHGGSRWLKPGGLESGFLP